MRKFLTSRVVGVVAFAATMGGLASSAMAAGYSISPVTTAVTSSLTSNVPTILLIAGGLVALVIAFRLVRKFVH